MKVLILCFVLCAASLLAPAQIPDPLWSFATPDGMDPEMAMGICRLNDSSVVVAGSMMLRDTMGFITAFQPYVAQFTSRGEISRHMALTSIHWNSDTSYASAVIPAAGGGCIVAGADVNWNATAFLMRYSLQGDTSTIANLRGTSSLLPKYRSVAQLTDSTYVLVGSIPRGDAAQTDVLIVKIAVTGGIQWQRYLGTSDVSDDGYAVVATPDTGFVVVGTTYSYEDRTNGDIFAVRYRSNRDTLWLKRFGGGLLDDGRAVAVTEDGGTIIAGTSHSFSAVSEPYLIRTDPFGQVYWTRHYTLPADVEVRSVKVLPDNGYILCGRMHNGAGQWDGFLLRLSEIGDLQWWGRLNSPTEAELLALDVNPDGGFYAAGWSRLSGQTGSASLVLRFPPDNGFTGTVRDALSHAPLAGVRVAALNQPPVALSDAAGVYHLYLPTGIHDVVTYGPCSTRDTTRGLEVLPAAMTVHDWNVYRPQSRINQTSINIEVHNHIPGGAPLTLHNEGPGTLDWNTTVTAESPRSDWLSTVPSSGSILPNDSAVIWVRAAADTNNQHVYDYYGWVTVHKNTCPDTVQSFAVLVNVLDADGKPVAAPADDALSAYPNPFNPAAFVSFELPRSEQISLRLYDVLGREVAVLREGLIAAGTYRVPLDGSALPAGIYFARLQTPSVTLTHKLMLLK